MSDRAPSFGNLTLSIEVVGGYGHGELILGTISARVNVMADDPAFNYPDPVFTQTSPDPLTQSEMHGILHLCHDLDELRRQIGYKAGARHLHTKERDGYLID